MMDLEGFAAPNPKLQEAAEYLSLLGLAQIQQVVNAGVQRSGPNYWPGASSSVNG